MGKLLSLLRRTDQPASQDDIFVDFENCQPSEDELQIWNAVKAVTEEACRILDDIENYPSAVAATRQSLQNPNDEALRAAAEGALRNAMERLKGYYQYSLLLSEVLPQLLGRLTSPERGAEQHLESEQALFKQFAELLDYSMQFDQHKMKRPDINNDMSMYGRFCPHDNPSPLLKAWLVPPTPLLQTFAKTTSDFVKQSDSETVMVASLVTMAHICRDLLSKSDLRERFQHESTVQFCQRVLAAVIVLIDWVKPGGAFQKSSTFDNRGCVRVLREQVADDRLRANLLDTIRFSSLHYQENTTLQTIRNLIERP